MKNLEFKLPEFGKMVGTTKWVAEKLEEIANNLYHGTTKSTGTPALFYKYPDQKGELTSHIFCTVGSEANFEKFSRYMDFYNYGDVYGKTYCLYPIETSESWGLFSYLTPKAKEIVEQFIADVVYEWITELEKL